MAPLSLKIVLDEGAVTRTLMFDTTTKVWDAHRIVKEKILTLDPDKDYGFFLTSADDDNSGVWLSNDKTLEYYMLRDGDSVQYLTKIRNIRLRMLDGSVKTLQVDESKIIEQLLGYICGKIGITNYEEYGLCREEETQSVEETKSNTGTLTLKRKIKNKDKDVQLEQLSKKLKTDDNVEWLDQHKTLRECGVDTKETLLFKRRLYYSDRNVDSRDPVQLNLLYVQTRDAILNGKQVVTEDKAAEFAGIQCQIQYGDFIEEKHKPGFIENLKEFLPEQYSSSWTVEKKIIKEHRKHNGLSQIEAKHLYTKTARELPTYGVTFFLVKEKQKGKKKLVPRLLGINSESILRLDEETKEILQVWLLTQVKSYRAGSESFTLNFGDYSEKEYAVKTNDAYRIRDILQGYIDIIRKRLAAPYNVSFTEGEAIFEDMVESSRGTITQTVVPRKVQEHSLVGPNEIISVDQGLQSQQGTRIVTVHEIITTTRSDRTQQAMRGEFRNSNSPHEFGKKLNHLNSEAVKAVVLLSDPTNENIQAVSRIVADFEDDLPGIIKGANEAAAGLKDEESKKLLDELDELCAFMNTLAATTKRSDLHDPDNLMTAQDAARKIAELSTQMCFSLDPKIKRCSKILSRSRKSFILDDKTEASLRRASFLNATDNACRAVEEAQNDLEEEYHGPRLTEDQIRDLERKTTARMGKLNAAIALLMNAHADPRNIDYEMAVNSMKTINEIMPGLIKDAKPLIANGDEDTKRKLRDQIIQLLNGTRAMCMLTGSDDISKMQSTGNDYADISKKLIITFNRPNRANPECVAMHDKENEIVQLAKDVGEKVSSLLTLTNELANYDPDDPQTIDLDTAGAKCADATQGLLACTKLTAPLIQEPHCQSALTAAAENLSSSVQNVALACKPLVEKPGRLGLAKQLADKSFDLAKALDKLKSSYGHLNNDMQTVEEDDTDMQEQKRLQFIISPKVAKDSLTDAHNQLQELIKTPSIMDPSNDKKLKNLDAQRLLSQKMAELNAAIASLLQSTADPENPDTDSAIAAIEAITKLTPNIINDTKDLHGTVNENEWNNIMKNLKDLLEATQDICAKAEDGNVEELNESSSKMAKSSGRLTFVFNPRRNSRKKDEILDLSKLTVEKASELQPKLDSLAKHIDGEEGNLLKSTGAKMIDDAERLLKTAEVIAPSIDDSRCQAALLSAIDRLSERAQQLHNLLELSSSQHGQSGEDIKHDLKQIQSTLDKLQGAVQYSSGNGNDSHHGTHDDVKQRLQFIAALSRAKNAVIDADNELKDVNNKPFVKSKQIEKLNLPATRNLLAERLARLNAAIANLLQATSDNERPDLEAAAAAINTISSVTPDVIKDVKTLQGSVDDKSWAEIMEHLETILDVTNDMCSNGEDPQATGEASIRLANSVGRLTYVISPRKNVERENQILDFSKSAVEQTSAMLSNVYQLIEDVGGDDGEKLDKAGVKVVDSAQMLLKTAEITAPSMQDDLCQEALLSAIDRLSDRARNLQSAWKPLSASPKYHQTGEHLDQNLKEVEFTLDKLREACKDVGGQENESHQRTQEQEKQRLHFNATLARAKNGVLNADKELKDFINKPFDKSKQFEKHNVPATKNLLAERLARLNAAIANLLQATSDNERPDLEVAAAAMETISSVTPDVIKDVKTLQGSVDDKTWAEIMENLKSILDATKDMCSSSEDPQAITDSSMKLANSVGRLTYVINPRKSVEKENQILDLSKSAVEQTSGMLSNVYQLIEEVGGVEGNKLDEAGVKVVDSAQVLLKTAEITAPSMENSLCQETLLSAIDRLSDRARDLQSAWKPIAASPKYNQTGEHLDQDLKEVQSTLNKLREACRAVVEDKPVKESDEHKKQRLQFVRTLSEAKSAMIEADNELKDAAYTTSNVKSLKDKNNGPALKNLLSQRLAELNAAIVSLIQATSDRDKPNYEEAAASINTISNLTPAIVKDAKGLRDAVDDKSWKVIMDNLKSLIDSTSDICANIENPQELSNSATKFANSAGRLTYVFNPRKNAKKENQIINLAKSAVEDTSILLSNVYQLTEAIGGKDGEKLDSAGVKVVDSAKTLLKTAEVTASSVEDPRCQQTLLRAIDHLSDRARDLQTTWGSLTESPEHQNVRRQLSNNLKQVQSTLEKLRQACQEKDIEADEQEKQHLQLIANLSDAKSAVKDAQDDLKKNNIPPATKSMDKSNVPAEKMLLSKKLAQLNAAIADLLQATSDTVRPDYKAAAKAINNISSLTPQIVKDTKNLHGAVEDKSWKTLMDNLKTLLDSTNDVCNNVEDPQALKDSASKFANAAGRLTYVFNPHSNVKKENQIQDLSRCAVEQTSLLLSNVYNLTEKVGGEEAEKLDQAGARVVGSAQTLLRTAEITSPSISDVHCQNALLASIDKLADNTKELKNTWMPLVQAPQYHSNGDQLEQNVKIVHATLDKLRKACQDTDDSKEAKPDHLLKSISAAKRKIREVEKLFSEDNMAQRAEKARNQDAGTNNKPVMARRIDLSQKLAKLNEAIARLLQAMLDRDTPDYKSAEITVDIISKLTPEIVQETMALQRNLDDNSGRIMFEEAKHICDASQAICTSVEDNNLEDLNKAAIKYAQSSRKLRYVVSPRSYPNKEKTILDISRSVCERTSLMLSRVSRLAESVGGNEGENMGMSGAKLGDAAHALFTNAQVLSSSIEDQNCQTALSSSADRLSKFAQDLGIFWKPVIQHPQHHQIGEQLTRDLNLLNSELDRLKESCHDNSDINDQIDASQQQQVSSKPMKPPTKPKPPPRMEDLDNLLENIQKTVAADAKKNKLEERLLIEDTPLRQLASKIMESAKTKAESNSYSPKEREKYSRFANELANAINRLDITNAKCRDAPFDAKDKNEKALQLENAILNLQVLCIQSRQKEGQQSNIVDLMEFVDDVTSAADDLSNTVKEIKHNEKVALLEIKNKCQKIQDAASKLTNPQDIGNDGNMFEDTLLIDQFTKNCDADTKEITAVINNITDEPLRRSLLHKLQALSDSCDLLSFATKSSISNTESATLEESLQNLGLVEQKIEDILKPVEGLQPMQDSKENLHAIQAAQSSLAAVVASGNENELPHTLTCYAVHMRGLCNHKDGNYKLKEHLKKLTDILKMQITAKNRRVVTWQEYNDGEVSTITEKILEELQSLVQDIEASDKSGVKSSDPLKTTQLIKNSDIKRLLAPNKTPDLGDEKHLKEKFNQQIQKLNSTTGTIALSVHKPESLTRSLHTASEAAIQLASIARGLKNQDPVQSKRIEEATQEMSVATYNLLKTSESVCHSSHLPESRRRLLDACRLLNDSLNNLARATTPANMQRDCNEMSRNLQLQQSFITFEHPTCSLNYAQCLDALQSQQEVIEKLRSEKAMSRTECSRELRFVTSAICNSTEYATQSAYLLTLSSIDKENVSKQGMVDVRRIKDLADSVNKTCLQIICNDGEKEISDQQSTLKKQVDQLQEAVDDACTKIKDDEKEELTANAQQLKTGLKELNNEIKTHAFEHKENRILPKTMRLMDAINKLNHTVGRIPQPNVDNDPKKSAMAKEVIDNNRNLISNTSMMLKKASLSQEDTITWSKIGSIDVVKAFETLLTCIREKGAEAGYIEAIKLDSEVPVKSFIQTQVDSACQWLRRPVVKESDKKAGVEGAENVVQMAEQMYDDLKGPEKEEMKHVIMETKQLINECTFKYNSDKASLLMERLKELRKMLERGVVTRVVEDFLEEEPLANLEALHKENDEKKRKFLLEKKIAELIAQLGRVTKTARFVADTGVAPRQELLKTSDQVELLAPALVKAAEQRIHRPDDQAAIKHYQKLLAEYADSLSRIRELCDRAVDPIDFSQAAGETMHRIKEESMDDPHKSVLTSKIIMKLCNRVIDVGMNSQNVKKDPELKKTLIDIKRAVDAKCEVKKADWRDVTAEFMRRTGEVESVLGGENIFLKQPEPDQPIYAAALDLHAAVRDWSARDNDIVAVAKRMAVLMARLSEHMNTGRKQELIYTSNSIVNESKEVAALAKKMALECSDIRIRTNLLQVCDRIPTISGQLKMLTTVKSSSLGHQDSTEDKEAMNMLVGNAQNLMISVQEVVKAAASASVKIMSQRGYRMKWRRRNYY